MKNPHPVSDFKLILVILFVFAIVIHCDRKPLYHEPSKQVFAAGSSVPEDALFGYSITYQTMRKKIIIGAPKTDFQGEVFECDTSTNHTCSKVNIKIDSKPITHTQSWLGAAVCAGSNFFLTCAPRHSSKYGTNGWYRTFSRCFYQSADSGTINKIPIELEDEEKVDSNRFFFNESKSNVWEKRFDTMGWSMDMSSDDVAIVGGPGAAMGRAMLIPKRKSSRPQLIHLRSNYSDPKALVLYDFGYSVKAGKFLGAEVYAITSPYGAMGQGKVLFFSKAREYIQAIVDEEIGSIFGGALCGALLGAEVEALLVGAPASALGTHNEIDVGAVYVYISEAGKMVRKQTIRGYKNKGYFGYAIATVGDLNLDGKDEVVISAPYENEYRGAVYIFSGADLVKDDTAHIQWVQRIEGDAPAQTLGLALSAVQDLDGNGCNELSIGLPGNNSALLMRCMAFITFTLSLEEKTNSHDKINATFVSMDMCVKFNYNEKLKEIGNYVSIVVKIYHPNAKFANSENNTQLHNVSLAEGKRACRSLPIMLPLNGDYELEIDFQVNASLSGQDPRNTTKFQYGLVMLTDETQTYLEKKLSVPGSILGMNLSTSFSGKYTVGSTKSEMLTIAVWNEAHSRGGAYAACVRTQIRGVRIVRASTHCTPAGDAVTCVPSAPIFAGERMISTITLDTASLTGEVDFIEIEAKLFKQCNASPHSFKKMRIPLQKDFNITVAGESIPSAIVNVSDAEISFGYEDVSHVYSIINTGMTNWGEISCIISIPQFIGYNISTDSRGGECTQDNNKKLATCVLNKLDSNTKRGIIVSMDVLPNTPFIDKVRAGKAQLATELSCMIGDEKIIKRTTTTMKLLHKKVPVWILVVAVLIGLLALLILTFVLYELGFLRRRHKEELAVLKRDIRRQSIRRSMRLRESMAEESKEQLLESNNEADETASVITADVTETETLHEQPESGTRRVVADVHEC